MKSSILDGSRPIPHRHTIGNGTSRVRLFEGVISTATHFMLKVYKEHGVLANEDAKEERLAVTP